MKHIWKCFGMSGPAFCRRRFLQNTVTLCLFFWLCGLYASGFWVCLLAFLLGQLFLTGSALVYLLLSRVFLLIREVLPHAGHKEIP